METSFQVVTISLLQISPNPNNPRRVITPAMVEEMAASLASVGLKNPIKVTKITTGVATSPNDPIGSAPRNDTYQVLSGHIRLAGAQKLGWASIQALVLNLTPEEALLEAILDNRGQPMNWLETAEAAESLMALDPNLTQQAIGDQLAIDQTTVSRAIRLTKALNPTSRALLYEQFIKPIDEQVTQRAIYALTSLKDPQMAEETLKAVIDKKMTEPQAKALVAWVQAGNPAETFSNQPVPKAPKPSKTSNADSHVTGAKAPPESAQPKHGSRPEVSTQAPKPAPSAGSLSEGEQVLWEAATGISVITQIKAKIKKGERPDLFEVFLLAGYNLWHGLVWLWKNGFRLTKLAVKWTLKALKFVWHIVIESLKVLGIYQFARAVVVIALLICLLIAGWYVHTHGTGAAVHLVYSKLFPAPVNTPVATLPPTIQPTVVVEAVPTAVPTKVVAKAKVKHTPVQTPVPAKLVQITPTVKPQGDLFTQSTDAVTKGANIAKAFGF